jgi:aspartate/methionine/tyrosine aminotransferase
LDALRSIVKDSPFVLVEPTHAFNCVVRARSSRRREPDTVVGDVIEVIKRVGISAMPLECFGYSKPRELGFRVSLSQPRERLIHNAVKFLNTAKDLL